MENYTFFILQLIVNCFLGSLLVVAFIKKALNKYNINSALLLITGMGAAPAINSLLLYYLLILLKGHSSLFYISIITLVWISFFVYSKKYFIELLNELSIQLKSVYVASKSNKQVLGCIIFIALYIFYWLIYVGLNPIADHDFFEYAIQGRIFAKEKAIYYVAQRYDLASDFCYVGLHGFSFPLLATLDNMQNELFGYTSDYFFKSLTGYYWILIVFLQVYVLNKINFKLAVFGALTLMLTYGYYLTFYTYHIDTYRIFFILLSLVFLLKFVKTNEIPYLILFGIMVGCEAFSHSLGVFLAIFQIGVLFLFSGKNLVEKIKYSLIASLLMLAAGGIHYIIDVLYGTGWIFQDIKFY